MDERTKVSGSGAGEGAGGGSSQSERWGRGQSNEDYSFEAPKQGPGADSPAVNRLVSGVRKHEAAARIRLLQVRTMLLMSCSKSFYRKPVWQLIFMFGSDHIDLELNFQQWMGEWGVKGYVKELCKISSQESFR